MRTRRLRAAGANAAASLGLYPTVRNAYHHVFRRSRLADRRRTQEFFSQFVSAGSLVFDVGANVGALAAEFLQLGARVVAIEPLPSAADLLEQRLAGPRLSVERVALGPEEGETVLRVGTSHFLSTISPDRADARPDLWVDEVPVRVTTLDSLIERYGVPQFLKIDVEGYELAVLEGLSHRVRALSFEVGLVPVDRVVACLRLLRRFGRYEFNFSRGNQYAFQHSHWLGEAEIAAVVAAISRGTGDVYARLADRGGAG